MKTYKSDFMATVHEVAEELYQQGIIDKITIK
jgi:hypothetical protein